MDSMAEEQNRTLTDKFMLRLPDGMRDRIKAAAETNNRSMNAEIVATLDEKYPTPKAVQDELIARLQFLRGMADDVDANRETEDKPSEVLRKIKAVMDRVAAQLPPDVVDATLSGWIQPPEFE